MPVSELMRLLIDCENQLGWIPEGDIYRARAIHHKILTAAMTKRGFSDRDLRLALNWCARKHLPITSPMQLLAYVEDAREMAVEADTSTDLDTEVADAITWEYANPDEHSHYWITRLNRAAGPVRQLVMVEWRELGRGQ
jgi:hypothetical protein